LRVLAFSHDGLLYGAQRSLLELLAALRTRGHEPTLAVPADGRLAVAAAETGLPARIVPYPYPSTRPERALGFGLRYGAAARRIRALVADEEPDAVIFNTAACIAPAAALRRSPVPRLWHVREAAPCCRVVSRLLRRWSDAVVFNSRHTAAAYPRLRDLKTCAVVHNGLDLAVPDASEVEVVRREFGWEGGDTVAVFVGQLRRHKDPAAVVAVAGEARRRGVGLKVAVVGDGPLLPALRRQVRELSLEDRVALTGFRRERTAILAAADLLLCPSQREPFGRVAVEAMALGLPVVAAHVGGLPEIVLQGETGLLVPPEDRDALFNAVARLTADRDLRRELGEAGRRRYMDSFTADVYAANMEDVLVKLTSIRDARSSGESN